MIDQLKLYFGKDWFGKSILFAKMLVDIEIISRGKIRGQTVRKGELTRRIKNSPFVAMTYLFHKNPQMSTQSLTFKNNNLSKFEDRRLKFMQFHELD